jgi:5-methyltetrahydropteroyltriglutamate--homocysteine methyltransferase
MQPLPIRTTVVGSYPFPGWLEFSVKHLNEFGNADREELIESMTVSLPPFTIR